MRHYDTPQDPEDLAEIITEIREELAEEIAFNSDKVAQYEGFCRGEDPHWAQALLEDEAGTLAAIESGTNTHAKVRDSAKRLLAAIDREPEEGDPNFEQVTAAMTYLASDNPSNELEFKVSPETWWSLARDGRFDLYPGSPNDLVWEGGHALFVLTGSPGVLELDRILFETDEYDARYLRKGPLGGTETFVLPAGVPEGVRELYTTLRMCASSAAEAVSLLAELRAKQQAGAVPEAAEAAPTQGPSAQASRKPHFTV